MRIWAAAVIVTACASTVAGPPLRPRPAEVVAESEPARPSPDPNDVYAEASDDPRMVDAVGRVWERDRDPRRMQVLARLAMRNPDWMPAILPYLLDAIHSYEPDPTSTENALAAEAVFTRVHSPDAMHAFLYLVGYHFDRSARQPARVAAASALGDYVGERPVEDALVHTVTRRDELPSVSGAAEIALGRSGDPVAIATLVGTLATPELFSDGRIAFAEARASAVPSIRALLAGPYAAQAAILLGDLRATDALPDLIAMLRDPARKDARPVVLEALVKIGDPRASSAMRDLYRDTTMDEVLRASAIHAYALVSTDPMPDELATYAQSGGMLGAAAIDAIGLLGRSVADQQLVVVNHWDGAAAQIRLAVDCGSDPACYARALPITDVRDFDRSSERLLRFERAAVELAKLHAAGAIDALLATAYLPSRPARALILRAIALVAPPPCPRCAEALDRIAASDDAELDLLRTETKILAAYER